MLTTKGIKNKALLLFEEQETWWAKIINCFLTSFFFHTTACDVGSNSFSPWTSNFLKTISRRKKVLQVIFNKGFLTLFLKLYIEFMFVNNA